jgi:hypothetical protein
MQAFSQVMTHAPQLLPQSTWPPPSLPLPQLPALAVPPPAQQLHIMLQQTAGLQMTGAQPWGLAAAGLPVAAPPSSSAAPASTRPPPGGAGSIISNNSSMRSCPYQVQLPTKLSSFMSLQHVYQWFCSPLSEAGGLSPQQLEELYGSGWRTGKPNRKMWYYVLSVVRAVQQRLGRSTAGSRRGAALSAEQIVQQLDVERGRRPVASYIRGVLSKPSGGSLYSVVVHHTQQQHAPCRNHAQPTVARSAFTCRFALFLCTMQPLDGVRQQHCRQQDMFSHAQCTWRVDQHACTAGT